MEIDDTEVEDCGDDSACDEPRCPSYRKYCDANCDCEE